MVLIIMITITQKIIVIKVNFEKQAIYTRLLLKIWMHRRLTLKNKK